MKAPLKPPSLRGRCANRRPFEDYEKQTIQEIRCLGSRLSGFTDYKLRELYREWSQETACAGWLGCSKRGLKAFAEWATVAPCDRVAQD